MISSPKSLLVKFTHQVVSSLNWLDAFFERNREFGFIFRLSSSEASSQRLNRKVLNVSSRAPLLQLTSALVRASATMRGCGDHRIVEPALFRASSTIAISIAVRRSCLEDGSPFTKLSKRGFASVMEHWPSLSLNSPCSLSTARYGLV